MSHCSTCSCVLSALAVEAAMTILFMQCTVIEVELARLNLDGSTIFITKWKTASMLPTMRLTGWPCLHRTLPLVLECREQYVTGWLAPLYIVVNEVVECRRLEGRGGEGERDEWSQVMVPLTPLGCTQLTAKCCRFRILQRRFLLKFFYCMFYAALSMENNAASELLCLRYRIRKRFLRRIKHSTR